MASYVSGGVYYMVRPNGNEGATNCRWLELDLSRTEGAQTTECACFVPEKLDRHLRKMQTAGVTPFPT